MKLGEKDKLQYDEETMEVLGVEEFVDSVKLQFPEFFKPANQTTINPATPGGTAFKPKSYSPAEIAKLSPIERNAVLLEMAKSGQLKL
jgi:hypothetical protein